MTTEPTRAMLEMLDGRRRDEGRERFARFDHASGGSNKGLRRAGYGRVLPLLALGFRQFIALRRVQTQLGYSQ
jgi:hypothetical protein